MPLLCLGASSELGGRDSVLKAQDKRPPCCWSRWGLSNGSELFLPLRSGSVSVLLSITCGRRWPRAQKASGRLLCLLFACSPFFESMEQALSSRTGRDTGPGAAGCGGRGGRASPGPAHRTGTQRSAARLQRDRPARTCKTLGSSQLRGGLNKKRTGLTGRKHEKSVPYNKAGKERKRLVGRTHSKCKNFISSSSDLFTRLDPAE